MVPGPGGGVLRSTGTRRGQRCLSAHPEPGFRSEEGRSSEGEVNDHESVDQEENEPSSGVRGKLRWGPAMARLQPVPVKVTVTERLEPAHPETPTTSAMYASPPQKPW
jgi:hypothetical protein